MEKSWRWFGENDPIKLEILPQIGVESIVTALHSVQNGAIWTKSAINDVKREIESYGLRWSVVESLPVSEAIKYGGSERDQLIENYKISLRNLGNAGVKTVCYNFMPVIDWVRTDLMHKNADGTYTLYFDKIKLAYFDCNILKRKNAENDYSLVVLKQVEELDKKITQEEKEELIQTIIVKTQRFVHGNFNHCEDDYIVRFNRLLSMYDGVDKTQLRENLKYFLEKIISVADDYNIKLCIHPDDPPFPVFGLPRIVTSEEDIDWILQSVDNIHNGITFCAGSLSAGLQNNVYDLAKRFIKRTHFVHLRSTKVFDNGDFIEASHLDGRGDLIDLVRLYENDRPDLPMRVDHGRLMLSDINKSYNPGYSLLGRMYALAQIEGIIATVRNEQRK
jgi:mannonate dehydratase